MNNVQSPHHQVPNRAFLLLHEIVAIACFIAGLICLAQMTTYHARAAFAIFQTSAGLPACFDSTPAVASGLGFTTCAFADSLQSSSTVDTNGSGAAGFNWYTQNNDSLSTFTISGISGTVMTVSATGANNELALVAGETLSCGTSLCPQPGTTITSIGTYNGTSGTVNVSPSQSLGSGQLTGSLAQPSNTMAFSGAGLTLSNVGQGTNNFGISTTHELDIPTSGAQPYHGTSFGGSTRGGIYARLSFAVNQALAPTCTGGLSNCRWPAWWGNTYPGTAFGAAFLESDFWDGLPSSGALQHTSFLHDYTSGHGGATDSNFATPTNCTLTFDGVAFTTVDFVWVPTTQGLGAGMYAFIFNDTGCGGNAVVNATVNGTFLTINSVISGTVATNSWITGGTVSAGTKISSGSGTSWTISQSQSMQTAVMIVSNGNDCAYYLSAASTCTNNSWSGSMSVAETAGNGFNLVISSGCTAVVANPTNCHSGTGDWPMKVKNAQVWCASISCKVVNFLLKRDLDPAVNDNSPMWLNDVA
jgi:hypothetical protein